MKKPGPWSYSIPERSIYDRPGKTIGSRFDDVPLVSTSLLARYYPDTHHLPRAQMPFISMTPRRLEPRGQRDSPVGYLLLSEGAQHCQTPLLRPSYRSAISRRSDPGRPPPISPGPAAYPMFELDEDILPRPQPGFTQKSRLPSDANSKPSPPFYYPQKQDRHSSPAVSIGRRLRQPNGLGRCTAPYSTPIDDRGCCSRALRPGATLKGRWSSSVYTQHAEPSSFLAFCTRGTSERKQPTSVEERQK